VAQCATQIASNGVGDQRGTEFREQSGVARRRSVIDDANQYELEGISLAGKV